MATTYKLQRLLNAAARLLSGTKKFDRRLSQLMHVELHWLDVPERVRYKLVTRRQLLVPRHNLSTYGRRAFSVAGPAVWNCLCNELREPLLTANSFRQLLKTRLFAEY